MVKDYAVGLAMGMGKGIGISVHVQKNLNINDYMPLVGLEHVDRWKELGRGQNICRHSALDMDIGFGSFLKGNNKKMNVNSILIGSQSTDSQQLCMHIE